MIQSILLRLLVLLWAVMLALLSLIVLSHTHIFSRLVSQIYIATAVDAAFLLLTVIYALFLQRMAARIRSPWLSMAALLPPCLILWKLLFFF